MIEKDGLIFAVNKHGHVIGVDADYVKSCWDAEGKVPKDKNLTDMNLRPATDAEVDAWYAEQEKKKPAPVTTSARPLK